MNVRLEFARKIRLAYNEYCKSLCKEIHMPQTAFDILMFLGNNPECKTARDIVEIRKIKANLVSVNVDKLVKEGYLTRNSIEGDRRKIELQCTEQALPIIKKGRKLQQEFPRDPSHRTAGLHFLSLSLFPEVSQAQTCRRLALSLTANAGHYQYHQSYHIRNHFI